MNQEFLQTIFLGNTVEKYIFALIVFVGLFIVLKIIWKLLLSKIERLSKKTDTNIDDIIVNIFKSIKPSFYFVVSFYFSLKFLEISNTGDKILDVLLLLVLVYQMVVIFQIIVNLIVEKTEKKEKDKNTKNAAKFIGMVGKWIIWILGILIILSNLGINITSLIAGLGIGGIAIAFALQNILGDLFSSFAIYFDKPFIVGDVIKVGDSSGTVIKIGIKTTRMKSFHGEEIVLSNTELTSARIQNFGKLKERRVLLTLGVTYETPNDKLKKIPFIIKEIVESIGEIKFGRTHFNKFNDSSLDFEIAYYILSDNYDKYMDIQQEINFKIKEKFDSEEISFAYPTKTIYTKK